MSISNWFQEKLFRLKTGNALKIVNNGNAVDEVVIVYKDIYISMFVDSVTELPTGDFAWSKDGTIFNVPIREYWRASPPQ